MLLVVMMLAVVMAADVWWPTRSGGDCGGGVAMSNTTEQPDSRISESPAVQRVWLRPATEPEPLDESNA